MRFELDQYINLRPVKLYAGSGNTAKRQAPEDIDFVVVRENTEGAVHRLRRVFEERHGR